METYETNGRSTIPIMFKIDLIVWKLGVELVNQVSVFQFKIDLIVWKHNHPRKYKRGCDNV